MKCTHLMTILLLSSVFTIWSCQEGSLSQVVTVDLPEHQPKPVIVLQLASGDTLGEVLLSNSKGITEPSDAYEYPSDATINLFRDDQLLTDFTFNTMATRARYSANFTNEGFSDDAPVKYVLEVNHPDFGDYTITQEMPAKANITNPIFEQEGAITPDGFREDEFTFTITDTDPGQRNYYGIRLFAINEFEDPNTGVVYRFENELGLDSNDPTLSYGFNYSLIFTDEAFSGRSFTARVYSYFGSNEELDYVMNIYSLTEDAYLYDRSLNLYSDNKDNPFAEPITVHSNIPDGLGVFSLANVVEIVF